MNVLQRAAAWLFRITPAEPPAPPAAQAVAVPRRSLRPLDHDIDGLSPLEIRNAVNRHLQFVQVRRFTVAADTAGVTFSGDVVADEGPAVPFSFRADPNWTCMELAEQIAQHITTPTAPLTGEPA